MRYAGRVGSIFLGMALVLSLLYVSSAAAARLTSPSFRLDTNAGGTFGGSLSSTNYKMTAIGGEAVVGNGASGSYILDQRTSGAVVPSMQITTQPSGLVGYYPLDENTGTSIYDNSSYSADGVTTGTPTWVAGKIGSGLQFNGSSQYVTVTNGSQLQLTSGTISAWVKTTTTSGTMGAVVKPSNYFLGINANKVATYDWGTSTTCQEPTTGVADGSWHYIALAFQSGVAGGSKLYKDGVVVNGSCTITVPGTTPNILIGTGSPSSQFFNGSIDNVKFFSSVLDDSAIMADYSAQSSGVNAGLSLNTITPGSSNTTTFDTIVTTNGPYSVSASEDHDLQMSAVTGAAPDYSESFSNVTPGANIATSNTTYAAIVSGSGATAVAANSSPLHGTYATYNPGTTVSYAYGRFDLGGPSVLYSRFYFRIQSYPVGQSAILMQITDASATDMSNVKITTAGKIALSNLSTSIGSSASAAPLNQWIRAEVLWNRPANTQTLRLYYGANVDGATPDETMTGVAGGSSTATDIRLGAVYMPKTSYAVDIDDTATSTTGWLGPTGTVVVATIPAVGSAIASPAAWSEGITKGLGFSLVSAPSLDSKWGSGSNFAAFPTSATTFYSRLSGISTLTKDVISMKARLDSSLSQKMGNYSNTVTITGTTIP